MCIRDRDAPVAPWDDSIDEVTEVTKVAAEDAPEQA